MPRIGHRNGPGGIGGEDLNKCLESRKIKRGKSRRSRVDGMRVRFNSSGNIDDIVNGGDMMINLPQAEVFK